MSCASPGALGNRGVERGAGSWSGGGRNGLRVGRGGLTPWAPHFLVPEGRNPGVWAPSPPALPTRPRGARGGVFVPGQLGSRSGKGEGIKAPTHQCSQWISPGSDWESLRGPDQAVWHGGTSRGRHMGGGGILGSDRVRRGHVQGPPISGTWVGVGPGAQGARGWGAQPHVWPSGQS